MTDLLSRIPQVRGTYQPAAKLAQHTWFGVGGPADILFCPLDENDLATFLAGCPADIPVTVMGAGSNLLVRDGGVAGVVVKMNAHLTSIHHDGTQIIAKTGATDADVARYAQKAGISGLEFLIGIPGTIGGGLRMNAGAYGSEFKDVTLHATGFDRQGNPVSATPVEMGMAYRHSEAPADWIFTTAILKGQTDDPAAIKSRMREIVANRGDAQPRGVRTGGSTFANPDGGKAWQEIDKAGCRGLQIGAARVSDKHCNFLINTGGASAFDIETLGETVRQRVQENGGPNLRWEIRRIGKHAPQSCKQEHAE
jgi:UDP-N-acetylmuramate dehydrogenase